MSASARRSMPPASAQRRLEQRTESVDPGIKEFMTCLELPLHLAHGPHTPNTGVPQRLPFGANNNLNILKPPPSCCQLE
jgi:hypothetical protein